MTLTWFKAGCLGRENTTFTSLLMKSLLRLIGTRSIHSVIAMSYHGARMHTDAARFMQYKKTGTFMPVTSFIGIDSVRAVLSEDAVLPSSKSELIEHQGWKVVDLTLNKRVHLSEVLSSIPEKTYNDVDEVAQELEIKEKGEYLLGHVRLELQCMGRCVL